MKTLKTATFAGLALLLLIGLSSLAGCGVSRSVLKSVSSVTSAEGGKFYAVGVEKAPFYRYGPQQGNGPDDQLPRDTVVRLIRNSFGYSKVVIQATGQQGYVASEDLTVASASLVAAATATPPPQVASTTTSTAPENFDLQSVDPTFVPPPEGLPAPDLPAAAPESSPSPL